MANNLLGGARARARLRRWQRLVRAGITRRAGEAVQPAVVWDDGLPTVTILMADAGGGHRAAALSLADALEGRAHVTLLNLLDDYAPFPINKASESYAPWVNHAPGLYHLVYQASARRSQMDLVERTVYPWVRHRVDLAFAPVQPDIVISVHPLLIGIPLRALRAAGSQAPFITVVTDPVSAHPAWFCPGVDLCVVATEEARRLALRSGLEAERVQVIGLPIRRAFTTARGQSRPIVRARLGLPPDLPLVLLSGGGAGIGKVHTLAKAISRRLADRSIRAQLAIIAGRNAGLLHDLQAEEWLVPVTALGFVDNMPDWLSAADLLISKAGPGTLAEAACIGVPILVTGFIPGQESGNVAWVEGNGAGAFAQEPERVADLVSHWLQPGNATLAGMADRARAIARPNAAEEIAQLAMQMYQRRLAM